MNLSIVYNNPGDIDAWLYNQTSICSVGIVLVTHVPNFAEHFIIAMPLQDDDYAYVFLSAHFRLRCPTDSYHLL